MFVLGVFFYMRNKKECIKSVIIVCNRYTMGKRLQGWTTWSKEVSKQPLLQIVILLPYMIYTRVGYFPRKPSLNYGRGRKQKITTLPKYNQPEMIMFILIVNGPSYPSRTVPYCTYTYNRYVDTTRTRVNRTRIVPEMKSTVLGKFRSQHDLYRA